MFSQVPKFSLVELKTLIADVLLEIDAKEIEAKITDIDASDEEIENAIKALENASSKNIQFRVTLQDIAKEVEKQQKEKEQAAQPTSPSKKIAMAKMQASQKAKYANIRSDEEDTPIEEMSSMAGGKVGGYSGPLISKSKEENKMDEIKFRKFIQSEIHLIVDEQVSAKKLKEQNLRHALRNLIAEVKEEKQLRQLVKRFSKEVIFEQLESSSEKEMFNLVRKEIAGVLKATVKILKAQQEGDPEQVQIGHLKAIIVAINNLFDQAEASSGSIDKLALTEQIRTEAKIDIDIGDVAGDITQSPEYMSPEAMENGGTAEEQEIDIEDTDHDEAEETTLDLTDDHIKTLYDAIKEGDPENASYQILGAKRALDSKTGSWQKVKKIFLNYSESIMEAGLPKEAWDVFRKWIVENIRLHLIATIQETASGTQTDGEEDLEMGDLGAQEPSGVRDLEF